MVKDSEGGIMQRIKCLILVLILIVLASCTAKNEYKDVYIKSIEKTEISSLSDLEKNEPMEEYNRIERIHLYHDGEIVSKEVFETEYIKLSEEEKNRVINQLTEENVEDNKTTPIESSYEISEKNLKTYISINYSKVNNHEVDPEFQVWVACENVQDEDKRVSYEKYRKRLVEIGYEKELKME